jgi:hypothetical protein
VNVDRARKGKRKGRKAQKKEKTKPPKKQKRKKAARPKKNFALDEVSLYALCRGYPKKN